MNYGQIKAAVAAYMHRTDLDALFPTFLELAEARIYFGEYTAQAPAVRVAAMRSFKTLVNGTRPTDFIEAIKVARSGMPEWTLDYAPLDQMPRQRHKYTWDGETLVLSQYEAFPVDLTYYRRLTTPVGDADANWLTTNEPRIYITSMLIEAAKWARDDELGVREAGNYISAVRALNSRNAAAQASGSMLRMRRR